MEKQTSIDSVQRSKLYLKTAVKEYSTQHSSFIAPSLNYILFYVFSILHTDETSIPSTATYNCFAALFPSCIHFVSRLLFPLLGSLQLFFRLCSKQATKEVGRRKGD